MTRSVLILISLITLFLNGCKTEAEKRLEEIGEFWVSQKQSPDAISFYIQPVKDVEGLTPELFQSLAYSTARPEYVEVQKITPVKSNGYADYRLVLDYKHKKYKSSGDCAQIIYFKQIPETGKFRVVSFNRCLGCG